MHYFNYAGLSPTRAEAAAEIQAVSDEFRTLLFSESGIAWYRKQVENCRQKVAQLLHVNLGEGAILSSSSPMPQPPIDSPCLCLSSIKEM
jgi:hypothetical protein